MKKSKTFKVMIEPKNITKNIFKLYVSLSDIEWEAPICGYSYELVGCKSKKIILSHYEAFFCNDKRDAMRDALSHAFSSIKELDVTEECDPTMSKIVHVIAQRPEWTEQFAKEPFNNIEGWDEPYYVPDFFITNKDLVKDNFLLADVAAVRFSRENDISRAAVVEQTIQHVKNNKNTRIELNYDIKALRKLIANLPASVESDCPYNEFIVYADGACNNLSPEKEGSCAYIVFATDGTPLACDVYGRLGTTNNRMEMKGIIKGCAAIPMNGASVIVRSDSQYAINILSGRWEAKVNTDYLGQHKRLNAKHLCITYEWVKGHADDELNQLVDWMAECEMERVRNVNNIPFYDMHNSPIVGKSPYSKCNRKKTRKENKYKTKQF